MAGEMGGIDVGIRMGAGSDFDQEVREGTVLVDFWAAWCGPCRMLGPVLEDLDQEIGDRVTIAKVNVDDHGELANRFGVMSIPTMILFKDGEPVEKIIGYQSKKALLELIEPHLE
jgi:thioredoxin 1